MALTERSRSAIYHGLSGPGASMARTFSQCWQVFTNASWASSSASRRSPVKRTSAPHTRSYWSA